MPRLTVASLALRRAAAAAELEAERAPRWAPVPSSAAAQTFDVLPRSEARAQGLDGRLPGKHGLRLDVCAGYDERSKVRIDQRSSAGLARPRSELRSCSDNSRFELLFGADLPEGGGEPGRDCHD
jgi:hypothetical protein